MSSTLKDKASISVLWNLFEKFGKHGITFVLGIILARLLEPKAFGLIGIVTVFVSVLQPIIEGGFGNAYVQKKEVTQSDGDTIFYINFGISTILYLLLWVSSPFIADFYENPLLIELIRVVGLLLIIGSFNTIQIAEIKRNMNFKIMAKVSIVASISSGIIAVITAYLGFGVWALVTKVMLNKVIFVIGLWLKNNWRPGFNFSVSSFKQLFSFGFWLMSTNLLFSIFDNLYKLVIGKIFPMAQLGFFTKANGFRRTFSKQISLAIASVSFPVFSKWQDDNIKLVNGIRKFNSYALFLIILVAVTLIVVARPFVILLLTEKWAPMIPYMKLLLVAGIFYPIILINSQVLLAKGKSKLNFKLHQIFNGLRILNIGIMHYYGVFYIILGEVIVMAIFMVINTYFSYRITNYSLLAQLKDMKTTILIGLITYLLGFALNTYISNLWLLFALGAFTSISLYILMHYLFQKRLWNELIEIKGKIFKQ